MKALSYALRAAARWWRRHWLRYRVYALHGIVLPEGSEIVRPEAVKIGGGFGLGSSCRIYCHDPENGSAITIGERVALNDNVMINADCGGTIVIGNDVLIAPNVVIRAANHRYDRKDALIREQGHAAGSIHIGDDVWIGANVVILPNVTVGRGAVVGAGSVVTHDVAEYAVVAGVPARTIATRAGGPAS